MNELIEQLEKATGPSRELDATVWASICHHSDFGPFTLAEGCRAEFDPQEDGSVKLFIYGPKDAGTNYVARERSLAYTASVDAALTLVPEGWGWCVGDVHPSQEDYQDGGLPWAQIWKRGPRSKAILPGMWVDPGGRSGVNAATPAIALCIAALRARSSRDPAKLKEEGKS